ncbi:rRNA methyltransferase 3, mitochondrial-like [Phymastichus coffea]|uniref:rRNA methyltransferase 3, mitochondrial-like n=1 Tax=Phymastichus coffea TaxID=108790 RepID=UPI00273CCEA5|nr:rRNA methyltransferase 3, mitochondrial-like [Phymastichus coffea]XP_058809774.1 rRNA methyltransferase 3, mitochondrial-like [Phymastichus coffea]XP_058809775.1 rRNA methyltransferase 3, mitochondrial-like [Phymastichus coffea]
MFKSFQLTVRNLRGITHAVSRETLLNIQTRGYSRFHPRHATIVNEDELFDVNVNNIAPKQPKKIKSRSIRQKAQDYQKEFAHLEEVNIPRSKDGGYNEFESSDDLDDEQFQTDSQKVDLKKAKVKKSQSKKKSNQHIQEEGMIRDKKVIYTKLDENDKIVSSLIMNLKTKKGRKKQDQILVEGVRFIKDAVEAGLHPEFIIFSRWEDVKKIDIPLDNIKCYKVPYQSIQMYSTLTTSPGVMGIFDKPKPKSKAENCLPITIICDNIRDPGNMGSILRAAAGVGCDKVVLTKGCVDFWDSKVLRSAAGAHFRIPIHGPIDWPDIKSLIKDQVNVFVADNSTNNFDEDPTESEEDFEEIIGKDIENDDERTKSQRTNNKHKSRQISFIKPDFPLVPYYAVDYTQRNIILIVGGETHGISKDSYNLVAEYKGIRVNVPLDNKIDSLNAGMALGVIAFEIKRQFALIQQKLNKLP